MKTIEEVAREAAERLVARKKNQYGGEFVLVGDVYAVGLKNGPSEVETFSTGDGYQQAMTAAIASAIASAIKEYCQQGVPSPGMTDERLREIEEEVDDEEGTPIEVELLAEVYFLRRLMADDLDRGMAKELAQARAECARLRGALQRIADDDPGHIDHQEEAQKALEARP